MTVSLHGELERAIAASGAVGGRLSLVVVAGGPPEVVATSDTVVVPVSPSDHGIASTGLVAHGHRLGELELWFAPDRPVPEPDELASTTGPLADALAALVSGPPRAAELPSVSALVGPWTMLERSDHGGDPAAIVDAACELATVLVSADVVAVVDPNGLGAAPLAVRWRRPAWHTGDRDLFAGVDRLLGEPGVHLASEGPTGAPDRGGVESGRSGGGRIAVVSVPPDPAGEPVLVAWWSLPRRPRTSDVVLLERLGQLMANRVRARRLEHERATFGHQVEQLRAAFAPASMSSVAGLELATMVLPSESGFAGDFVDLVTTPGGGHALVVGDAAGRGLEVVPLAVAVRHSLRAALQAGMTPNDALQLANLEVLRHPMAPTFVTVVIAQLAQRSGSIRVQLTRAGHPCPLVRRCSGRVEAAATGSGQLLGVFPRVRPAKDMVFLDAGDVLVLYTDGVTESVVDGSRWEESGLVEAIAAAGPSPSATAEVVRAHLSSLAGTGGADDATVVVVGPAGVDPD